MAVFDRGTHHFHKRKGRKLFSTKISRDQIKKVYDKIIYGVVVLTVLSNLPQLLKIWLEQDATGVSMLSWSLFSMISVLWFGYGLLHKDVPLILLNSLLFLVQTSIVVGIVLFS